MNLPLLPYPEKVVLRSGFLSLRQSFSLFRDSHIPNLFPDILSASFKQAGLTFDCQPAVSVSESTCSVSLHAGTSCSAENYRLSVDATGINIESPGLRGLFYGIQTLRQIITACSTEIPYLTIEDRPSYPNRGYYLDISRGKVPTLPRLKQLVDRLAFLKYNQFQFYTEHVYEFEFDSQISRGSSPLTAKEILELDAYCAERFIELVPSLACFGHMGRILSLPKYRHLAEIEFSAESWENADWLTRLRGSTLNPLLPEARTLISQMLKEYLPLFKSEYFNACGDETHDLGKGVNAGSSVSKLYLDHMFFLKAEAEKYGKKLMFWGDVMLQHPESIPHIPHDATILDWGYEPKIDFHKAEAFRKAGLDFYVCPGTRGYKVIFNEIEKARENIKGYAKAGADMNASGFLLTDWGDLGHFNMLACSLHGMALGGALAWNHQSAVGTEFDDNFAFQMFGDDTGMVSSLFRTAGTSPAASWPVFLEGINFAEQNDSINAEFYEIAVEDTARLVAAVQKLQPGGIVLPLDLDELNLGMQALNLNARRIHLSYMLWMGRPASRKLVEELASDMREFAKKYRDVWLAGNKESNLTELHHKLIEISDHVISGNV